MKKIKETGRKEKSEKIKKPLQKRPSFWITVGVVVLILVLVLVAVLDYNLFCLGIKIACTPGKMPKPDNYEEILANTDARYDLSYESEYPSGIFDIYSPKGLDESRPLVLYIHGGYYIGGGKASGEPYCRIIANEGYVVVSMEYAFAPKYKYPTQIKQVNEILGYLTENSEEYNIDPTQIFIGGDSAGCHLSAQAGAFFTNTELAQKMNIERKIDGKNIKGLLLLCGFFNMDTVRDTKFPFVDTALWAFTDVKEYENFSRADEMNIVNLVDGNYPDSFVTCGSDDPFYDQSKELVEVLDENGVSNVSYLPISTDKKLKHEFQREFDLKEANIAMEKTIQFLNDRSDIEEKTEKITATFALSNGVTFDVELYEKYAPTTVANFIKYAEAGFYNGTVFHRILKDAVLQGGGYTYSEGNYSYKTPLFPAIKGEFATNGFTKNTLSHTAGTISMARSSINDSATCQFFFCAGDQSYYDGQYAAFGRIVNVGGIEALRELTDVEKLEVVNPSDPITIISVVITKE